MKKRGAAPAYLEVLRQLYRIIDRDYADGGPLPPSRVMCRTTRVSRVTYNKAVARLISEGVARSNRKGGTHVIPAFQRIRKVGVVLRNAEDCPFVGQERSVPEAFSRLFDHDVSVQMIQASPPGNIGRQALLHNIDSLLWFFARASSLPVIAALERSGVWVVLVDPAQPIAPDELPFLGETTHVIDDPVAAWSACAEFLSRRGRRRTVLYLGSPWVARRWGLCRALEGAGHRFAEEDCVASLSIAPERLARLVDRKGVDTVITEGGNARQELLFKALSSLPPDRPQPEVLARQTGFTLTIAGRYPRVRLVGVLRKDAALLGREAAELVVRHLAGAARVASRVVGASFVEPV